MTPLLLAIELRPVMVSLFVLWTLVIIWLVVEVPVFLFRVELFKLPIIIWVFRSVNNSVRVCFRLLFVLAMTMIPLLKCIDLPTI